MTDDEKRELITRATKVGTNDVVANPRRYWGLIRELADALEGTPTEPEWEWAVRQGDGVVWDVDLDDEPWTEQTAYLDRDSINGGQVVRRRKAGPWEVITDDRD